MRTFILLLFGLAACRSHERQPAPPADTLPAEETADEPAFGILSPRPGDTLVEGSVHVIHWRATGVPRINLGAAMGGKDKGHLLIDVAATPDSFAWQVPVGFVTGFGVSASSDMRLRLEDAGDPNHYVEAGPFTITGNH